MTDDRDFKRLVRERMATTGETYTEARAHLRPPTDSGSASEPATAPGATATALMADVESFRHQVYDRSGLDRLGAHLYERYGTRVTQLTHLDAGVLRVDRDASPSWIARVFPTARSLESVEGDAEVLRFLEQHDVPAERCAHSEPVSVLDGQGVLVTEVVPGTNRRGTLTLRGMYRLGRQLGHLHTLPAGPGGVARPAGGWHHLSVNGGGRREDVAILTALLASVEDGVAESDRPLFDQLRGDVAAIDDGHGLPIALTHPDPCGANAIADGDGDPVLIDWTGAGRGPRAASFAIMAASSPSLDYVNAAVAGYRHHVQLGDDELARLPDLMEAFPIVLDCWSFLFQKVPLWDMAARRSAGRTRARVVAARVAEAFAAGPELGRAWEDDDPDAADRARKEQGTLF